MVLTCYLTCNIILLLKAFHCDGVIIRMSTLTLRYYAAFKVRKFKLLFYKINTFLQKKALVRWIAGRANILCKYIIYIFFSNFGSGFCGSFPMGFAKAPDLCGKQYLK